MKRIGILGGMAPESTREYYRIMNNYAREIASNGEYPEIVIFSLNFSKFRQSILSKNYSGVIDLLKNGIESLEKAGVDFALIASNTPHMFFEKIQEYSSVPLLNIAEVTAERASKKGYRSVGLLGTKTVMEKNFYRKKFRQRKIQVVTPKKDEMEYIDKKISEELTNGKIIKKTKQRLIQIAERMNQDEKIDAIVLGCTELPLIINDKDLNIPLLNTTKLHAKKAIEFALEH